MFDAATAAFAEAAALTPLPPGPGQPLSPGAIAAAARPVVGPADVEADVLRWLHDEEAVPAPYLQAAADAYAAAAEAHGVAVPASLHLLALDVALQQGHALQAAAALVAQPGSASPEAAERLEALAEAGRLPGLGFRVVDGVRARLGLHTLRCRALLRQGRIVRALRLARRHQVESLPPAAFLHAAAESGEPAPAHWSLCAQVHALTLALQPQATWACFLRRTGSATSPSGPNCRTTPQCCGSTGASCLRLRRDAGAVLRTRGGLACVAS